MPIKQKYPKLYKNVSLLSLNFSCFGMWKFKNTESKSLNLQSHRSSLKKPANIRVFMKIWEDSCIFAPGCSADYRSTHSLFHCGITEHPMCSSKYSEKHHPSIFHNVLWKSLYTFEIIFLMSQLPIYTIEMTPLHKGLMKRNLSLPRCHSDMQMLLLWFAREKSKWGIVSLHLCA